MSDWKEGLFGCFSNIKVCLITWLCPIATVGAIAENLGEDTFVCGALKMCIPIYNCIYFRGLRVKAAKNNGIAEESCGSFLLKMWCCGACMVCQTGNEVGAWNMAEEMEKQTIERV